METAKRRVQRAPGLRPLLRLPWWAWALAQAVMLYGSWLTVLAAGGSHTALPHLFYVPIVLAALPFGPVGGLLVALIATILAGPLMPLDATAGVPQDLANWLTRGVFFLAIGSLAGLTSAFVRRSLEHELARQLRQELDEASRPVTVVDPGTGQEVRTVIERRGFHPVFQPVYSLVDGRLLAVEALTRFDSLGGDPPLPPNVWFDRAAQAGMAAALDLVVIEEALAHAGTLPADVALHINVTPPTLRDPRLPFLLEHHARCDVVIEVTEHAVIEDYHRLRPACDALRRQGVRIAVDDAGAGFASLRHVVSLQPEIIKLDISLTQNVRTDPVRHALAEAIVHFAERTGTLLITEGIEEPSDLATWQRLGAQAAQGYLLGRPGALPAPPTCSQVPASRFARAMVATRHPRDN